MLAVSIRFDPDCGIPAVRQIVDNFRVLLVNRSLAPGAEIPSVRRLAMELGVHFNTVADAYRELAAEGWLELRHGRGAVVISRDSPPASSRSHLKQFQDRLRVLVAQMRAQGVPADRLAAEMAAMAKVVKDS